MTAPGGDGPETDPGSAGSATGPGDDAGLFGPAGREIFGSRLGLLLTTVGAAVGLGNVWRFPYMTGQFGGTAFVALYLAAVLLIGIPALVAEWTLGRHTRRGPVGAFLRAGVPGGRALGWLFFGTVAAATAYYTLAIGWVVVHGLAQVTGLPGEGGPAAWLAGGPDGLPGSAVLPPETGFGPRSFGLQLVATGALVLAAVWVLRRGLRSGIEAASRVLIPVLFGTLLLLIVRAVTLPGAGEGVGWFILKFEPADLTGSVTLAALGQAVFSLSLGGTFMVVYGSHMGEEEALVPNALWTAVGDTTAGLLAGLAIFPAVFALGLEPGAGPELLFSTLPRVFAEMPAGAAWGALFFLALGGGAFLSALAAYEVLVAGLVDEAGMERPRAVRLVAGLVFLLALPPMVNMEIFVPWDLTFGSGMQTFGALVAALTVGWALDRGAALEELAAGYRAAADAGGVQGPVGPPAALHARRLRLLHLWIRWVIPAAILAVGLWWLASEVL